MSDVDLTRLRTAVAEVSRVTNKRDKLVRDLRAKGATWTEIGYALNTSAQAAQQKYGSGDERSEAHRERAAKRAIAKKAKAAREAKKAAASETD